MKVTENHAGNAPSRDEESTAAGSRRTFLRGALAAGGAAVVGTADVLTGTATAEAAPETAIDVGGTAFSGARRGRALLHRVGRATHNLAGPYREATGNGDESALPGFIGSFSKGLPHNGFGEVDPSAYTKLLTALASGRSSDYAAIPLGGTAKLVSPQASFAFQMEGLDVGRVQIPAPPTFSSELRAAEMNEVYWQALLRDVPFARYGDSPLAAAAVADLRRYALWSSVTPQTLFRGPTAGDRVGPYLSQLLYRTVPFGMTTIPQQYQSGAAGQDFMTTVAETIAIQRGIAPSASLLLNAPHFMRNGRDLAEYVHRDFSYQAFMNAALVLLGLGGSVQDDANPYKSSTNLGGFVTFGGPDVLSAVANAGVLGLKAAWWAKWAINRTLRPEVFALRVQQHLAGVRSYPINGKLLNSTVLPELNARFGTALLPMAYPEGSPLHPSYPAGHATIAGACTTVLKAFFKESAMYPTPVQPSDDGSVLTPWTGTPLTVGGELDKLASNISLGRDIAGVHYWSDGVEGLYLGEQVGIAYLRDLRSTYAEDFGGFTLTRFDGTTITV